MSAKPRLTRNKILQIRKLILDGYCGPTIKALAGVGDTTIRKIRRQFKLPKGKPGRIPTRSKRHDELGLTGVALRRRTQWSRRNRPKQPTVSAIWS